MTQEEKQLLLVDLCARLPYGVKIKFDSIKETVFTISELGYLFDSNHDIIPYLRPMSSMTEEEYEEFCKTDKLMATLLEINKLGIQGTRECHLMVAKALGERVTEQQNWLNSHHFDYRGLIEKGLALEAPEGSYNTKTE